MCSRAFYLLTIISLSESHGSYLRYQVSCLQTVRLLESSYFVAHLLISMFERWNYFNRTLTLLGSRPPCDITYIIYTGTKVRAQVHFTTSSPQMPPAKSYSSDSNTTARLAKDGVVLNEFHADPLPPKHSWWKYR
jgi:hypothetical protein